MMVLVLVKHETKTAYISAHMRLWYFCNTHSRNHSSLIHTLTAPDVGWTTPGPSPIEPLPEICFPDCLVAFLLSCNWLTFEITKQVEGIKKQPKKKQHILAVRGHLSDLWVSTFLCVSFVWSWAYSHTVSLVSGWCTSSGCCCHLFL